MSELDTCDAFGDPIVPGRTPLPICEPRRTGESIVDHGARVLSFLLAYSCTATLNDSELAHADLAAHYAITARGILPTAADRISDVRHLIATVQRDRSQVSQTAAPIVATGAGRPGSGNRPELLDPRPKSNPPAPAYAKPEIAF